MWSCAQLLQTHMKTHPQITSAQIYCKHTWNHTHKSHLRKTTANTHGNTPTNHIKRRRTLLHRENAKHVARFFSFHQLTGVPGAVDQPLSSARVVLPGLCCSKLLSIEPTRLLTGVPTGSDAMRPPPPLICGEGASEECKWVGVPMGAIPVCECVGVREFETDMCIVGVGVLGVLVGIGVEYAE